VSPELPNVAHEPQARDDGLAVDEDDGPVPGAGPAPFRVPARVLADSLHAAAGPCFAVLVPHGLFLEREPMKPFLYVPARCPAESGAPGELTVTLPDRRAVTLRFETRYGRALARDTRAFLAGARPVPAPADYRRRWWMLWPAVVLALGLAAGPLVLSESADLGTEFGLQVGAGFALAGLLANAAVVLFSRLSAPGQLATMAGVGALVTGVFLFGAAAYLAGRQRGAEEARQEQPPPPAPPAPPSKPTGEPPPVEPPSTRPPSHLDRARRNGSSALDDGPADVVALALAPDNTTLALGYADGTVRQWPLDQPTFEAMLPGPKADGPVLRVQYDAKNRLVFAYTAAGVVAAPRAGPPPAPARIPGTPVAVAAEPAGDRLRFAAVRGNLIVYRTLADAFILKPPVQAKGKPDPYTTPTLAAKGDTGDEVIPPGTSADPAKPGGAAPLTFLAWTPGGKLLAGQPTGTIAVWDATMKPEPPVSDHKAPVRAWAGCGVTGDFATADDQGTLAVWSAKADKTKVTSVFATPVTGLSFNTTGTRLLVTDSTGWVVIWDVAAGKAVYRVKRPAAPRAAAYGPTDDYVVLSAGKTAEVWWVPELVK
jgi:hypothetical protein